MENNFYIDKETRTLVIPSPVTTLEAGMENKMSTIEPVVLKEYTMTFEKKFLEGTKDKYKCYLEFREVPKFELNEEGKIIQVGTELKAFAVRVGYPNWVLPFNLEEYTITK